MKGLYLELPYISLDIKITHRLALYNEIFNKISCQSHYNKVVFVLDMVVEYRPYDT